ncbi:MAG TPA: Rieske 2Fe-2S domain-containing protein [Phenylobacterium sp.]|uniref:Rieske 2Fe-2S domain-containing protein n=1 Tax=Phenylobacterium sp. TaxID=1871053 RepID=UPI002B499D66|nr:Rieske 2Fe-2S domain-containing protein [Phenylobacterium sp.]HKR89317.1 Rieske 2Fe-2S domain-containing protein [Phenylobacterium sp.]
MLSAADNDRMCRVGPGTPQGTAMRRFWIPALLSSELPAPDCDPVRVQALGEDLVAFRDSEGQVGLIDEYCRHRNASLSLGRVEGCGIRCIYHGWKFDRHGNIMETPNVADPKFKQRFKAKAYPVREVAGMVWTYMGPAELEPPFPHYAFMDVPDANRLNAMAIVPCNFVQVMEGLVDSSHLSVLHTVGLKNTDISQLSFAAATGHMQFDAAPHIEADDTDFGFHYVAIRRIHEAGAERTIARVAAFQSPCFVFNPNGDLWFAVVPMSDERTMFFHLWWDAQKKMGEEPLASEQLRFVGLDPETLEEWGMTRTTVELGRLSPHSGYMQDREAMRRGHFTGIANFTQEDAIVSMSAGALRDRSREMLCVADLAITCLYRALLKSANAGERGEAPIGLNADVSRIRGANATLELGVEWRTLVPEHRLSTAIAAE